MRVRLGCVNGPFNKQTHLIYGPTTVEICNGLPLNCYYITIHTNDVILYNVPNFAYTFYTVYRVSLKCFKFVIQSAKRTTLLLYILHSQCNKKYINIARSKSPSSHQVLQNIKFKIE